MDYSNNQRRVFADELLKHMQKDTSIWVLTGDLGYKVLDDIRSSFPGRFINCGASEQAMMDIAIGLALEGKKPFVYSITPFLLYRPFEALRTYIDHEKIPVRLIGSGRDDDYIHDGYSHNATDVQKYLAHLYNVIAIIPQSAKDIPAAVGRMVTENIPWFISLKK